VTIFFLNSLWIISFRREPKFWLDMAWLKDDDGKISETIWTCKDDGGNILSYYIINRMTDGSNSASSFEWKETII